MGTGWRRAFCTTVSRDGDQSTTISDKQTSPSPSPSPRRGVGIKLGFFSSSGSSNPSTPRLFHHSQQPGSNSNLLCRTTSNVSSPPPQQKSLLINECPKQLQCKTTLKSAKSAIPFLGSNPSSPRSPLKLSLFRNSFRLRNTCGVCMQSVKTGQGMAIYTAECAHAFHFPCIAAHVRKQGTLVCPVCNAAWKDVPLLAVHKNLPPDTQDDVVLEEKKAIITPKKEMKKRESSPRQYHHHHLQTTFSDVRSYDDDEPLLSPTAGGKFVPIPEAEEKEGDGEEASNEDDVEEFQGFFFNPTPSCSIKSGEDGLINGRDSKNVEVRLMPEAAVVSVSSTHETYAVALRVKAPPSPPPLPAARNSKGAPLLDPSRRAPIDLVTVLDVSGSMSGAKLQMLKRAMRLVISSLGSADRLSIVSFSACPKRLLPLRRMTAQGQRSARRIIDRLVCGQGTSVGDALRKATKVLEDRRERNPVASIILLSDGHDERVQANANHQRQAPAHVSSNSTRFAHVEIPARSFEYGKSGGYSHEPAEDAFAKCVGGLLSVVVQDLHIQLGFASGSAPAEISAVYCCNGRPTVLSSGIVRLGDLYAEEERELLVELRVPTSAVGSHHVMSVRCSYKDPATQEVLYNREHTLMVPAPNASRSSSSPRIERLRYLFITTRAIAESRRLVEHNGYSSAQHLLSSARALLMQSSSISADEYIRGLEAELVELAWRRQQQLEQQQQQQQQQQQMMQRRKTSEMTMVDENEEPLTPTSAWRAAEQLAKVAIMKKSLNRVSDLHGFENARF